MDTMIDPTIDKIALMLAALILCYLYLCTPLAFFLIRRVEKRAKRGGVEVPSIISRWHPWHYMFKCCGYAFAASGVKPWGLRLAFSYDALEKFKVTTDRFLEDRSLTKKFLVFFAYYTHICNICIYILAIIVFANWEFYSKF